MTILNKKIKTLFAFSLGLSIGLPLGILGIVFGAINKWWILLALGILLVVAGFYGMPILWVKYAERRGDRMLLRMIETEYIYTVSGLARQSGYEEKDVRERLRRMIHQHILVGYLYIEDTLILNTNEKQEKAPPPAKKCQNCGAEMIFDDEGYRCDYCGSRAAELY